MLPRRPGIVQRAQLSTPFSSICASHDAARSRDRRLAGDEAAQHGERAYTVAGVPAAETERDRAGDLGSADEERADAELVGERDEVVDDAVDRPAL